MEQLRKREKEMVKSVIGLDIDNTITEANNPRFANKSTLEILRKINEMGHFAIPVTGKALDYAERIFQENEIKFRGIIAENGAVYKLPGQSGFTIFGGNIEALENLKEILCLHKPSLIKQNQAMEQGGRELPTVIKFQQGQGAADQEPACVMVEGGKHGVLTLFTESALNLEGQPNKSSPESELDLTKLKDIQQRWPEFRSNTNRDAIYHYILETIQKHNLADQLSVLPPHADGAIDIVRIDPALNKVIDKSLLPIIIEEMYGGDVPLAMFGDGANDIPALAAEGVYAVTFSNVKKAVREAVVKKGHLGFISASDAPLGLGVVEGLYWLSRQNFFKEDTREVEAIIKEIQPRIIENREYRENYGKEAGRDPKGTLR